MYIVHTYLIKCELIIKKLISSSDKLKFFFEVASCLRIWTTHHTYILYFDHQGSFLGIRIYVNMIIIINPLHMAPDMLLLGPNLEVLTPNFGPILKGFSCSSSMY